MIVYWAEMVFGVCMIALGVGLTLRRARSSRPEERRQAYRVPLLLPFFVILVAHAGHHLLVWPHEAGEMSADTKFCLYVAAGIGLAASLWRGRRPRPSASFTLKSPSRRIDS